MNQDLKIIKKKYGENMAKLCRTLFPTLLETKGLLPKLLLDNFEPDRNLCEDLINQGKENDFKNYIYSFVNVETNEEIEVNKTPEELLGEAGYDLYECKTEEDIQSFRKYYAKGEELCTFNGGRLNSCIVFFAVKKDVDNIKRKDFSKPKRQDLYGTSVISIQFKRDKSHTLSIKNRYNHRVSNPDSTFSNDLDNIIPGLTKSFEKNYGLVQRHKSKGFEILGYVKAQDGKYYKFNYERNNIYYCTNNIIIDHFGVKRYPKDKYLVFDYFILDLENKKIYLYDERLSDSFTDTINDIEKIEIIKEENKKLIKIKCLNQEDIKIKLNRENLILELSNPNVELVGNDFLEFNKTLQMIDCPNLKKVGSSFLKSDDKLQFISLPKLQKVGHSFLQFNNCLKIVDFPSLKEAGTYFMGHNTILETINCPKLQKVGHQFLNNNQCLKILDLPSLEEAGTFFMGSNTILETINCPKLQKVGDSFLEFNECLKIVEFPNLKETSNCFLLENKILETINCPKLQKVGDSFLKYNKCLKILDLPNLKEAGTFFMGYNTILETISCPKLQKVDDHFLRYNKCLKIVDFPNLKEIGQYFLMNNVSLKELNCPNIYMNKIDSRFMQSHPIFNGKNMKRNAMWTVEYDFIKSNFIANFINMKKDISLYEQKKLVLKKRQINM